MVGRFGFRNGADRSLSEYVTRPEKKCVGISRWMYNVTLLEATMEFRG
jgi:hypothetical protein